MRDQILAEAQSLIKKIQDFEPIALSAQAAKQKHEALRKELDGILATHAQSIKNELHTQIIEVVEAYRLSLAQTFESDFSGMKRMLEDSILLIKEIAEIHSKAISDIKLEHLETLETVLKEHQTSVLETEKLKLAFSKEVQILKEQIKDTGVQFNASSNIAQSNLKRILDGFTLKLENKGSEEITKDFVKETIKEVMNEGFLAATQQIRDVAPLTKRQTEQVEEVLLELKDIIEDLKVLKNQNSTS
jgi:hypothetical protein